MIAVGFTGTRLGMSEHQLIELTIVLDRLWEAGAVAHHGCCVGADTEFHNTAGSLGYLLVLHPPLDEYQMTPLADLAGPWQRAESPLPFLKRNRAIVENCTVLLAAPADDEQLRSGTWATVRYARLLGRPVKVLTR